MANINSISNANSSTGGYEKSYLKKIANKNANVIEILSEINKVIKLLFCKRFEK